MNSICFFITFATICFANTIDEQYNALVKNILENGEERDGRNGGTIAVFAPPPLVFDVSHEAFPIITTKKVNLRLIADELFWMVSGSSTGKDLRNKKVYIWDANTNENGQAGVYGMGWRFFGAKYSPFIEDMKAQPHTDQLANAIDLIMNNPTSRRILVSAWNALDIDQNEDVLPPCHFAFQFYVKNNDILDMQIYQRSQDVGLGAVYNYSSYSLLLLLIAHVTCKTAGKITYILGDTHLYQDHVSEIKSQLRRKPYPLPSLYFDTDIPKGSGLEGLLRFKYSHLRLENYHSHPAIRMNMSA